MVQTSKIPNALRIATKPEYDDEEKAIINFVNGDTDIHQFMAEVDAAYGGPKLK